MLTFTDSLLSSGALSQIVDIPQSSNSDLVEGYVFPAIQCLSSGGLVASSYDPLVMTPRLSFAAVRCVVVILLAVCFVLFILIVAAILFSPHGVDIDNCRVYFADAVSRSPGHLLPRSLSCFFNFVSLT